MQSNFPQIIFQVRTIDDVQLAGQCLPDSKNNILKNLKERTVFIDYIPYALKHGDTFTLYGEKALNVLNQYRKINNYGWTLDILYYGPLTDTNPTPNFFNTNFTADFFLENSINCKNDNEDLAIKHLDVDNLVSINKGKYEFNGEYGFYGVNNSSYTFRNVPPSHPIAFLNYGMESKVSYIGQFLQSPDRTAPDGKIYKFYYGDVTLNVIENFGTLSYANYYFGYFGGENNIIWN